jgi:hypothetical protein
MVGNIVQAGAINPNALGRPGLTIQIQPPAPILQGIPTNVSGIVGTGVWGPVNVPVIASDITSGQAAFGQCQARKYDLCTQVAIQQEQGAANFRLVRVTDGTDTAATSVIGATDATITALYTGSLGNSLSAAIANGSQPNTWRITLTGTGLVPERFDNISGGVVSNTVTPGTGATAVPALTYSAPTLPGGIQAVGNASLTVVGTPTIGAGGTGVVANDFITFSNGVVLKAATVVGGVVTVWSPVSTSGCSGGSLSGAGTATPTNPVAMISTTGAGTGVTANLVWGLGPVTMLTGGQGYASATVAVGASGGSGTIAPAVSVWANMAAAINNGQSTARGPSNLVTMAAGSAIDVPTVSTHTFTGGTDGYGGVTSATLVGSDVAPRKGMYALRKSGCGVMMLADADDSTQWTYQLAFGLGTGTASGEETYMIGTTPAGDTIGNATGPSGTKATAGIDEYPLKLMFGDWLWWYDQVNGLSRLVSPQAFIAGRIAAMTPQNSSLNKPLQGIQGSQKSGLGTTNQTQTWSDAEVQLLNQYGIDIITNPSPGGSYWSAATGHNTSSNAVIHGEAYTRMTNFIASTLSAGMGIWIGKTVTMKRLLNIAGTIRAFLQALEDADQIGTIDGSPCFSVICDATNNTQQQVAIGNVTANVKVVYLGIIENLLVNLMGGASVTIQRAGTQSTQ